MKHKFSGLLVSSFNLENLVSYLNNIQTEIEIEANFAKYGQIFQVLMDERYWNQNYDFAIIWTLPEKVSKAFDNHLNQEGTNVSKILEEVDSYCDLIKSVSSKVKKAIFIPIWSFLPSFYATGMLDLRHNIGTSDLLMQMNLRVSANFSNESRIYLLNTQKWTETVGRKKAFNPKMWYMGKMPFGNEVFREAATDVISFLAAIAGDSRKLIILDLDETLWGGIVGEVGWEKIVLGGHDPAGEALVDFQRALKNLTKRGILLGIVSKNEEGTALEAIEKHPEMVLRLDDFAGWRINWKDKAENILALVEELNLGLQSTVFIDDKDSERHRVRTALPEVLVPEWPEDKMRYRSTLLGLRCFDSPQISIEDSKRTQMYVSERHRKGLRKEMVSVDAWLNSLGTKVDVALLNKANLARTAQLFNKTNQMNLTTRRLTEPELKAWSEEENHRLWTFRVSDRFGDSGLTGIVSLELQGRIGTIADFILSCRVMGRKIEEVMLHVAVLYAKSKGIDKVFAKYIPTKKNSPCLEFFRGSGFIFDEKRDLFVFKTREEYRLPSCINLTKFYVPM